MTKKHFIALAGILKARKNTFQSDSAHSVLCFEIAQMCKAENPRFEMSRFLDACDAKWRTELQWQAALTLLREAENEIQVCDGLARGSYYTGNEVADRIKEFLKSLGLQEQVER